MMRLVKQKTILVIMAEVVSSKLFSICGTGFEIRLFRFFLHGGGHLVPDGFLGFVGHEVILQRSKEMANDWHAPGLAQQPLPTTASQVPHVSVVFRKTKQPLIRQEYQTVKQTLQKGIALTGMGHYCSEGKLQHQVYLY